MLFNIREIIELLIMVVAIGYIFSGFIKKPVNMSDPFSFYKKTSLIEDIKYGIIVAAPAVVLHELAHKFTAMSFGATATLHAPIGWYVVVAIMRLLNSPFMFFVGGYVTIYGVLTPLESAIVSISGPLVNLILFLIGTALIKFNIIDSKHFKTISISSKLNLFLFAFNMLPLPGFDGLGFFQAILSMFI